MNRNSPEETSSWSDDLKELKSYLPGKAVSLSILKWGLFAASTFAAATVALMLINGGGTPSDSPAPVTPAASPSATVAPTPTPTATSSEEPEPVVLSRELIGTIPAAWRAVERDGCLEAWTAPSDGVSSLLVFERANEAFSKAGFRSSSLWSEDSLRLEAVGNNGPIREAELVFTLASIELCLR